ncbi:hypothetical protein TUM4637_37560 [Shewanella hafniensis]|jgi:hypothetical protein|nr:hypothetical protein TUM4637_37560 [Shewanella hafniensis]
MNISISNPKPNHSPLNDVQHLTICSYRLLGVDYSYYVKSVGFLSETALKARQTLLAKILDA